MIRTVRGATKLIVHDLDENARRIHFLLDSILKKNALHVKHLIFILFSQTDDIDFCNPATLLRRDTRFASVPLFCTAEPQYPHAQLQIVRVLVLYKASIFRHAFRKVCHVYQRETVDLRKDLV